MAFTSEFSISILTDIVEQIPCMSDIELTLLIEAVKFTQDERRQLKADVKGNILKRLEKDPCEP